MTVDELPENLDEWPSDDVAILGVGPQADERTIKLAYAARIKRFKPERFPQHFRRLRDAYERLTRIARWRSHAVVDVEREEAEADDAEDSVAAPIEPPRLEAEAPPPDDRWDRACAGELVDVYAEYRDAVELQPTVAEHYI